MAEYIISEEELNSMFDAIGSQHIEDGEEIIRCRDCKHRGELLHKRKDGTSEVIRLCKFHFDANGNPLRIQLDKTCSWAERDE